MTQSFRLNFTAAEVMGGQRFQLARNVGGQLVLNSVQVLGGTTPTVTVSLPWLANNHQDVASRLPALTLLAGSDAAYTPNLPLGYSEVAGEFQVQAAGGYESISLTFLVL